MERGNCGEIRVDQQVSMENYHLDTSALMRLLVQQPREQYVIASGFLEEKLVNGVLIYVCDLALAEAYFAMQNFYKVTKADAIELLRRFTLIEGITVSPHALQVLSMANLASAKPGFVDRLIHGVAAEAGQTLVTFEKAGKNLTDTVVLGG